MTPETSKQKSKTSPKADEGVKKSKLQSTARTSKEIDERNTRISHSTKSSSDSEDVPSEIEHNSLESEEVRETTKPVTPEASNQKKKTSPKADGGNKKRKLSSATRSVKEYIQKKMKITQSAQGSSQSEDPPREVEQNCWIKTLRDTLFT